MTLINKLAASICWVPIFYNIFGLTFEIALTLFGPFNEAACYLQLFMKNTAVVQLVHLILGLTLAKYVTIFIVRNPTRVDANFWSFYIMTSSLLMTLVFQV